jgi:MFS family permease
MKAMRWSDVRALVSGVVILAVAMGVGRFAYTPLLPVMEHDAGLSVSMAGALAFTNLFGYLAGALLAMHPLTHRKRLAITRWSVAGVVVMTGLMAGPAPLWLPLRFFTGVCSGLVLVLASSLMLERAARARESSWPPLFFSGVGWGIAFSGVAVPALVAHGGSRTAWAGIAIVSAAALLGTARWFTDDAPPDSTAQAGVDAELPRHGSTFTWLLAVYAAEAFVYIIPATFLVAIIAQIPQLARYASLSWVIVGLAGAFAMIPWIHLAAKLGKARALAVALGVQAVGIGAAVFSRSPFAVMFSAVALGGTFMAITQLAAGLARDMFPNETSAAMSRLTVVYSIGQMLGPLAATNIALHFDSYDPALLAAVAIAGVMALVTLVKIRDLQMPRPRVMKGDSLSRTTQADGEIGI